MPLFLHNEDVILESLRAAVVSGLLLWLFWQKHSRRIYGFRLLLVGFSLLCFASLIDITDNFPALNHWVVIGDTPIESFLEKVVGYLGGFICLSIGFYRWLPAMQLRQSDLEKELNQLEQLLPICASCKAVRDEQGHWHSIENHLKHQHDTDLTHSICPDCVAKQFH